MLNELEKLAAELAALPSMAKAMQASDDDNSKIQAAAADGEEMGDGDADDEGKGKKKPKAGAGDGDADDDGGETPFGKSFSVTLEDGSVQEAFDGTSMMKALHADIVSLTAENASLKADGESFAKAMSVTGDLVKDLHAGVAAQGLLIKSLQADLTRIGGQGAGRKAVVNIHEKAAPASSGEAPKLDRAELMAKALSLQAQKIFTALDVSKIATRFDRGLAIDAYHVAELTK